MADRLENDSLELSAPAKLTLSLRITGVRADGYHLIEAEMVSLDLCDRIVLDPSRSGVVVDRGGERESARSDDLVVRAIRAVGREVGATVHKLIPLGAGLGGGSSDAAAVLRWAALTDPRVADPQLAVRLGADVPFCVRGGRAMVSGIGEVVEPLEFQKRSFTLLTPPIHASTPVVYKTWDELGEPHGHNGNDLEPAALAAYPELTRWRDQLAEQTGREPRLAGSGSTWFVEGDFPGEGRVVARTLEAFS